jgi:hypothetical protein
VLQRGAPVHHHPVRPSRRQVRRWLHPLLPSRHREARYLNSDDGINAALANEAAFQAGKPLVIEEWYALNNADGNELSGWIASSTQTNNGSVTGWVGQWPTRCSFLAMGNPSGCSNDTVGFGLVAARTVIDVALTVRSPKGFPEV